MVKTFLFQLLVEEGLIPNIDQIANLITQNLSFYRYESLVLSQQQKCARRKNCDWLKFVSIDCGRLYQSLIGHIKTYSS